MEARGRADGEGDIVVYEVMVDALDRAWWADYRKALEKRLGEQELVVRALPMERL